MISETRIPSGGGVGSRFRPAFPGMTMKKFAHFPARSAFHRFIRALRGQGHFQMHREAGAGGERHQGIEAEFVDAATQQVAQAWLGDAEKRRVR